MVPPFRAPFRGRLRGRLRGREHGTRTEGGVSQKQPGGCPIPPFHCSLSLFGLFVLDRPTRTAPAERDETGATPPFRPLARFGEGGVYHPVYHRVYHHPPPRRRGGRSRPHVSLLEGSPARARAGRPDTPSGAMIDRLLRAVLVIGDVSAACAWTWPGAFPEADPVAVLVRFHTPNVYAAVVAWYYVAPGVAVLIAGQFFISTARIWFARMGVRVGLRSRLPAWPLSPAADAPAIVVGEVHHPVRAIESPGSRCSRRCSKTIGQPCVAQRCAHQGGSAGASAGRRGARHAVRPRRHEHSIRSSRAGVGCGQSAEAKPEMSAYTGLTQNLAP